ncbi:uncharacterized protein EV422DRAFT_564506 [Fimicolochytrium jonesii]|uniref:uncharacterized protein n=1 Tax=Fimicolochytrium jonesii TaxID=1396493 RepID=UPI0022FDEDD8|nr:uncharacterized protein EV422DRAFT_564506 [Fimicolochytrium jonesii]KAI8825172.1 hypothetical protein EV422DRAFT_564506 [Fimicolochytrium jonesii]
MSADKRLYIFDLDNTLYLGRAERHRRLQYERRLLPFLNNLAAHGHLLAVATFNTDAEVLLLNMGIRSLFDSVVQTARATKSEMVSSICSKYPYIPTHNVHYYDDDYDSVMDVRALGIRATNVAPLTGVPIPTELS